LSTVKVNAAQIGQSVTATNNFTWYQPASPDGTVRLGNGNSGSVTDLITVGTTGNLTFTGTTETYTNSVTISAASTKTLTLNGGAGSNGLVLDASNNIGIGTSSPAGKFVVAASNGAGFEFLPSNVTNQNWVQSYNRTTSAYVSTVNNSLSHLFYCSGAEQMRLDSTGSLFIGGTSGTSRLNLTLTSGLSAVSIYDLTTSGLSWQFGPRVGTGTVTDFGFYNISGSVLCGRFTSSGAWYQGNNSAVWSVTSDKRIKKNIVSLANGLDIINSLRPVEFDYKENDRHDLGFIAQEYEMVLPDQIVKENPNDVHKEWVDDEVLSIQQNLTPYLVKAIQELSAELNELKQRIK